MKMRFGSSSKSRTKVAIYFCGLTFITVLILSPMIWIVLSSLKTSRGLLMEVDKIIPSILTLEHYRYVFEETYFFTYLYNSCVVALSTTAVSVIIAIFASYSFSRFRFYGRGSLGRFLIATQMFPGVLIVIPLFLIMKKIGLLDTYLSLIIVYTSFALPFCTWMLRGFFDGIPVELEEAALLDGCSYPNALVRVILPISAPGVAAVAIFSFILAWNEFLFALVFIKSDSLRTLPIGVAMFMQEFGFHGNWGPVLAQSVLVVIPASIFFILVQKLFVEGLVRGAIKG